MYVSGFKIPLLLLWEAMTTYVYVLGDESHDPEAEENASPNGQQNEPEPQKDVDLKIIFFFQFL
jgi:hypothetical protein